MNCATPLCGEVQYYRKLPPFKLPAVAGPLYGLFLVLWVGVLGRPLGALEMPTELALAIGLPFGVLLRPANTGTTGNGVQLLLDEAIQAARRQVRPAPEEAIA